MIRSGEHALWLATIRRAAARRDHARALTLSLISMGAIVDPGTARLLSEHAGDDDTFARERRDAHRAREARDRAIWEADAPVRDFTRQLATALEAGRRS